LISLVISFLLFAKVLDPKTITDQDLKDIYDLRDKVMLLSTEAENPKAFKLLVMCKQWIICCYLSEILR
jgi:hypothetical protein